LFFLQPGDLHVEVDAFLTQLGRRTFEIPTQAVKAPPGVVVTSVEPGRVDVSVQRSAAPTAASGVSATPSPSP
jgi:hypothetical protein